MIRKGFRILVVILFGTICVCPFIFLITGSITGKNELMSYLGPVVYGENGKFAEWMLIPKYITLQSYLEILLDTPSFFMAFWNTLKITVGILSGQVIFGIPAAWGLARYKFPLHRVIYAIYILLMLLPFQVIMLSEYLVLDRLSIIDSIWAIILPNIFSTFPVIIMILNFENIEQDIIDAAKLDGADGIKVFLFIGVPIGLPGIMSAMVWEFFECWNMIEQPMTFISSKSLWTLSMYIPAITLENARMVFVVAILTLLPCFFVFGLGREYLEKGIQVLGVKE